MTEQNVEWKLVYRFSEADSDILSKITYISDNDAFQLMRGQDITLNCFPAKIPVNTKFVDTKTDRFVDYIRSWAQEQLEKAFGNNPKIGITRIEKYADTNTIYLQDELYWNPFAQAKVRVALYQLSQLADKSVYSEPKSFYDELYTFYALRFCLARRAYTLLSGDDTEFNFVPLPGIDSIQWTSGKAYKDYQITILPDFAFNNFDSGIPGDKRSIIMKGVAVPSIGRFSTTYGQPEFEALFKVIGRQVQAGNGSAKLGEKESAVKGNLTKDQKLHEYKVKAYMYFQLMHAFENKKQGSNDAGTVVASACNAQAKKEEVNAMFQVDRESQFIRFLRVQHIDKDIEWQAGLGEKAKSVGYNLATAVFPVGPSAVEFGGQSKAQKEAQRRMYGRGSFQLNARY